MSAVIEHQPQQQSLLAKFATRFGVEPNKMLGTLKATAFKGEVSNEQMMALLIVADQYGLNPWTKEIYAFPDRNNGIVPVVGVDGWARIINTHPAFDGMEFIDGPADKNGVPEWIECVIHRKDRSHAIRAREYFAECRRDVAPWKSHPRRMLRHKSLIQCSRLAFGYTGIYDQDEAERIVDMGQVQVAEPAVADLNARLAERRSSATDAQVTDVPAQRSADAPAAGKTEPQATGGGGGSASFALDGGNGSDDAPPYTFAELEQMIRAAATTEALDDLGALVAGYPTEQQPDLSNEIGRRRKALSKDRTK